VYWAENIFYCCGVTWMVLGMLSGQPNGGGVKMNGRVPKQGGAVAGK
jgi:hypothetical protein